MKKLLLLVLIFSVAPLFAATITVTNTDDAGAGSLRQAIIDASPGDTVNFDLLMLYSGNDTIKLESEISINKALVIDGYYTSDDTLFISGQNSNRIFNISASSGTLKLNRLTLINGSSTDGGAIYKSGGVLLEIEDCNIMDCEASGRGGGIYKGSGVLNITSSHIMNNSATDDGGGMYMSSSGSNTIEYTTFSGNSSLTDGGAMYGIVAHTDFNQCTFTENSADDGGAIYNWGSAVIMNVTNCTFINNSAVAGSGAIEFWGSSIEFTIGSTVIVGNGSTNMDVWGAGAVLNSNGYNVIGDASYGGSIASDQLGVSAVATDLGALQDNGGKTYTMMPNTGSVAIDNGDPTDMVDAQNGPITDGTRDAGAAENYSCPNSYVALYTSGCATFTVPSGDETYTFTEPTIVYDTIPTACGSDSILTLIVLLDDIEAPVPDVASLPNDTSECEATPTPPTATDACEGIITGTTTTSFPITTMGTTVVTWTFDDGNGNTTTQDQNIIVTPIDSTVSVDGITITSNSVGSTYQWLDCDDGMAPISGATSVDFTPTENGSYAVEITNGSCVDTSECTSITQIGFAENTLSDVQFYPNPTSDVLNINTSQDDVNLTIFSAEGKVVFDTYQLKKGTQRIDLKDLERGVYLLEFKNEIGRSVKRLIIQ